MTALHYAAKKGHAKVVIALWKARVNLEKKNDNDDNALHIAAKRGHKDVVEILILSSLTHSGGSHGKNALRSRVVTWTS